MMGFFKEEVVPLNRDEAWANSRRLLISWLNKGSIPTWEIFYQDLPVFKTKEDLESVKKKFLQLTEWNFLREVLNMQATEFFFHGRDNSQVLMRDGCKERLILNIELEDWQLWMEIVSIKFCQNWNVQNPFCSFYGKLFGRDYRFSMVHESTSPGGTSKLIMRSLNSSPWPLYSFGEITKIPEMVRNKKNILIAGSTGSGKTSLLSSLLELIERDEHLVVLEDTFEIMCTAPHQTRFLSGLSEQTSLKAYLTYSLRLSPDRLVLGEMRSHEVVPYLLAMNTGHRGLMGTIHASSATDALNRVALLFTLYSGESSLDFEKVMELLCRNLEYVIYMENKKIKEIIKILGCDKGIPFYERVSGHCRSTVAETISLS